MRQRDKCRFEGRLVTCRRIHVSKLGVRGDRAAARADRNERAISTLVPGCQMLEPLRGRHPPAFFPIVDVSRRLSRVAGKSRAGVKRSVGPDGVGVFLVYLARSHVHAVDGRKAVFFRFVTEVRQLLVDERTGVADA